MNMHIHNTITHAHTLHTHALLLCRRVFGTSSENTTNNLEAGIIISIKTQIKLPCCGWVCSCVGVWVWRTVPGACWSFVKCSQACWPTHSHTIDPSTPTHLPILPHIAAVGRWATWAHNRAMLASQVNFIYVQILIRILCEAETRSHLGVSAMHLWMTFSSCFPLWLLSQSISELCFQHL